MYTGLRIILEETGQQGTITGSFAKKAKLKVLLDDPLTDELLEEPNKILNTRIVLHYKKSVWQDKSGKKAVNKFKFN